MKKISCCISLIILICLSLCCCVKTDYRYSPVKQKNTQWMSDDGRVFINSNQNGYCSGYIIMDNKKIPIQIIFTELGRAYIYGITDGGNSLPYYNEHSEVSYNKDLFKIKVLTSTFFEKGKGLIFHKLKDEEKIEFQEIPLDPLEDIEAIKNTVNKNAELFYDIVDYDEYAKVTAYSLYESGIKSISSVEAVDSIDDGIFIVKVIDSAGGIFYALVDTNTGNVNSIFEASIDGKLLYKKGIVQD